MFVRVICGVEGNRDCLEMNSQLPKDEVTTPLY